MDNRARSKYHVKMRTFWNWLCVNLLEKTRPQHALARKRNGQLYHDDAPLVHSTTPSFKSVPLVLIHESLAQNTIFQCTDKVSIALVAAQTACSSPLVGRIGVHITVRRWRVVCRTRLQPNRSVRVEMTGDTLDRRRNTSALMVHRGRTLTSSSCCCLRIKALRRRILRLRNLVWHQIHLMGIARWLSRIRWRGTLLRSVHPVVHGRGLSIGGWMELVHLHRVCSLCRRLSMRRLCSPLLTCCFCLLLLLDSRRNGFI